jgi:hypothetical protein
MDEQIFYEDRLEQTCRDETTSGRLMAGHFGREQESFPQGLNWAAGSADKSTRCGQGEGDDDAWYVFGFDGAQGR